MLHDLVAIWEAVTRWPWGLLILSGLLLVVVGEWRKRPKVTTTGLVLLACSVPWAILGYWIAQNACCS